MSERNEGLAWLQRQWRFERILDAIRREGDRVDERRAPERPATDPTHDSHSCRLCRCPAPA